MVAAYRLGMYPYAEMGEIRITLYLAGVGLDTETVTLYLLYP